MQKHIERAAKVATNSNHRFRLGAVVLSKNKVVSTGFNKIKTHPKLIKYGHRFIHAETASLLRGVKGDTLVVVRLLKNGSLACSRPCKNCLRFMADYGIKRVFYIDWNAELQEMVI